MQKDSWLSKFLVWRVKHISNKNLVWILSIVVGIASGLAAVILKSSTHFIQDLLTRDFDIKYLNYLYLAYPLIGIMLSILFIRYLNHNKLGKGLSHILYDIGKRSSLIKRDKTYSHVVTSALTVGFGGSVGLEAPIVTTGSAIGSNIGRFLHMGYKNRSLLIGCGAAGAIAAIFNAPIAGVIFTMEVLLLELTIPSFIPILLAAITGNIVTKVILGEEILFYHEMELTFALGHVPFYIALGIICGLMSVYFTRINSVIEKFFDRFKGRFSKGLIGGVLLGVLILFFPALYGEGFPAIKSLLDNDPAALFNNSFFYGLVENPIFLLVFIAALILLKVMAMTLTISGGGNGGIFAPSLFMGALTGFLFARTNNFLNIAMPIPESNFALVGMAGLVSGVMHAPLTGIFMIAEITSGYELVVPLMLVSAISYATFKYFEPHSIYTKQLAKRGDLLAGDKDRTILTNLKLKRVIEKDLQTITPDKNLGALVELVAKSQRNIFPVVDEENTLNGIILLDDIRQIMFKPEKYETVFVKDLMHPPPAYVSPRDDMDKVMQKFQESGAWNLPVVDDGKYIGFLSKSKIFSIYRRMLINQAKEE